MLVAEHKLHMSLVCEDSGRGSGAAGGAVRGRVDAWHHSQKHKHPRAKKKKSYTMKRALPAPEKKGSLGWGNIQAEPWRSPVSCEKCVLGICTKG